MRWLVKRLALLIALLCLGSLLVLPAAASGSASLTVCPVYNYSGNIQVSSGAMLGVYKIANMSNMRENGNAKFSLTDEFSGLWLQLNLNKVPTDKVDYSNNDLLTDYIWEHKIQPLGQITTSWDTLGKAEFSSLEPGLYFVAMVGAYPEYTRKFLPLRSFTIPVPVYSKDPQGLGNWSYEVTVNPKLSSADGYYYPLWENGEGYFPGFPFRPSEPDYPLVDPNTGTPYDPDNPPPSNIPTEPTKPTSPPDGPVDLKPPSGDKLPQTGLPRLPVILLLTIGGALVVVGVLLGLPPKEDKEDDE